MRLFELNEDAAAGYSGAVDAAHKWKLPGVICPGCVTWGAGSKAYPSVDLSPISSSEDFATPRAVPLAEYERLRDLIQPLLPAGAVVEPGSGFGPLVGTARGRFGALACPYPWWVLIKREALEKLQNAGLQGLKGCPTELHFRQRHPPELLELELLPAGRLHEDCLPPGHPPPCPRCGRHGLSLPDARVLEPASLPTQMDVFRLVDFSTVIVCTERFADACRRLGLTGVTFTPLSVGR